MVLLHGCCIVISTWGEEGGKRVVRMIESFKSMAGWSVTGQARSFFLMGDRIFPRNSAPRALWEHHELKYCL